MSAHTQEELAELANYEGREQAVRLALEAAAVNAANSDRFVWIDVDQLLVNAQKIYSYIWDNELPERDNLVEIN